MRAIDADALKEDLTRFYDNEVTARKLIDEQPTIQPEIVRCKDCKHNPKYEWFGCPMSHLSEKQRPETAWCWKAERRTDERSDKQTTGDRCAQTTSRYNE